MIRGEKLCLCGDLSKFGYGGGGGFCDLFDEQAIKVGTFSPSEQFSVFECGLWNTELAVLVIKPKWLLGEKTKKFTGF